jgi:hypothetical protein
MDPGEKNLVSMQLRNATSDSEQEADQIHAPTTEDAVTGNIESANSARLRRELRDEESQKHAEKRMRFTLREGKEHSQKLAISIQNSENVANPEFSSTSDTPCIIITETDEQVFERIVKNAYQASRLRRNVQSEEQDDAERAEKQRIASDHSIYLKRLQWMVKMNSRGDL